jgi:hypothetical protein
VPESIVGLDTLLLAVVVVHLGKAKDVQGELQAIIVVKELDGAGNSEDDISVVLDGQGVDDARVLANPIARTGNPVISVNVALATLHLARDRYRRKLTLCNPIHQTW